MSAPFETRRDETRRARRGHIWEHFEFCRAEHSADANANGQQPERRAVEAEIFSVIIWTVSVAAFALGVFLAIRLQ